MERVGIEEEQCAFRVDERKLFANTLDMPLLRQGQGFAVGLVQDGVDDGAFLPQFSPWPWRDEFRGAAAFRLGDCALGARQLCDARSCVACWPRDVCV